MQLEWRGTTLAVREMGSGPSLILVHGYPLDGAMWSSVARRLSGRFRVVKPDLPGRGENPSAAEGSIDAAADFLEALAEACEPPVGLAGFSMGGYVALALMKRTPAKVRALALVDTRAVADDEAARSKRDEAMSTLREKGVEPIADAMLGKLLSPASLAKRDLAERVRRIMLRQPAQTLESDLTAMRDRPDSTGFLGQISIPTLVLVGAQDSIAPPAEGQAMAQQIPGARFVTIPDAGHLTPMESPGAVAQALGDFFASALSGSP